MSEAEGYSIKEPSARGPIPVEERWKPTQIVEQQPRAVGSPLPIGSGNPNALAGVSTDALQTTGVQPADRSVGRGLANPQALATNDITTTIQKTLNALKSALPFVQRILPMLDGNFGTAVANLLTQHPQSHPPAPPVNLAPLHDKLTDMQTQHGELRAQIAEQNTSLKRVEDQLEMVREATDRNTLEQQELLEDLKMVGNKVNLFAWLALGLLAASVMINVILFLHIRRVLP
jgi:hypothetical protein